MAYNINTSHQQTRDELGSESDINPLFERFTEKAKLLQGPTKTITRTLGNSFVLGSTTNGALGYVGERDLHSDVQLFLAMDGTTNDFSTNNYPVSNFNATLTTNQYGTSNKAYSFNGTTSYCTFPSLGFTAAQDKSIMVWYKVNADAANNSSAQSLAMSNYFRLHVRSATNNFTARYDYSSAVVDDIIVGAGDRNWHLGVGTFKNNGANYTVTAYLDGVSSGSPNTNSNAPTSDYGTTYAIGLFGTTYFSGSIGQVVILDRTLSAAEVLAFYNATRADYQNALGDYRSSGTLIRVENNSNIFNERFWLSTYIASTTGTVNYTTGECVLENGQSLTSGSIFYDASNTKQVFSITPNIPVSGSFDIFVSADGWATSATVANNETKILYSGTPTATFDSGTFDTVLFDGDGAYSGSDLRIIFQNTSGSSVTLNAYSVIYETN
jgi:hypothetical protein